MSGTSPAKRVAELLRATPFGGLDEESAERLAALFAPLQVGRGELLQLEGERESRFIVVGSGRLKAFSSLPGEREITVFVLGPGDFFGFLRLLDGGPFPVSVAALDPSEVFVLLRQDFERAIRRQPEMGLLLLGHLARRLRECLDQVGILGHRGAVARTAHALLSLLPERHALGAAGEVTLPFSQAELARVLDITAENLSRALSILRRRGVLERLGRRRFRIIDPAALQAPAEGK